MSPSAERARARLALKKDEERHPEDYRGPIYSAGLWYGPALGKLGPRNG